MTRLVHNHLSKESQFFCVDDKMLTSKIPSRPKNIGNLENRMQFNQDSNPKLDSKCNLNIE